jgi:hypothetical protein
LFTYYDNILLKLLNSSKITGIRVYQDDRSRLMKGSRLLEISRNTSDLRRVNARWFTSSNFLC